MTGEYFQEQLVRNKLIGRVMINFKKMFENEETQEIIFFLSGRKDNGISHPQLDGYCTTYGNNYISNIELISLVRNMQEKGCILPNGKGGYKKGPNWNNPNSSPRKNTASNNRH